MQRLCNLSAFFISVWVWISIVSCLEDIYKIILREKNNCLQWLMASALPSCLVLGFLAPKTLMRWLWKVNQSPNATSLFVYRLFSFQCSLIQNEINHFSLIGKISLFMQDFKDHFLSLNDMNKVIDTYLQFSAVNLYYLDFTDDEGHEIKMPISKTYISTLRLNFSINIQWAKTITFVKMNP